MYIVTYVNEFYCGSSYTLIIYTISPTTPNNSWRVVMGSAMTRQDGRPRSTSAPRLYIPASWLYAISMKTGNALSCGHTLTSDDCGTSGRNRLCCNRIALPESIPMH